MKPRLRKIHGVWSCCGPVRIEVGSSFTLDWFMGHGYTPQQAYTDWQEQTRAARSAATT